MTTINNENILMMFEEINQKLNRSILQIEKMGQKQPEVTHNEEASELKSAIENFHENQSERLYAIENAIRTEKRKIELTPTSSFGMVFFLSMILIILTLSVWTYSLRNQIGTLADNDLKYRYIQMQGKATAKDFTELDSVFSFNRNTKKIKLLRKQVETFEDNVKQRARILEQEERLKREREKIELKLN